MAEITRPEAPSTPEAGKATHIEDHARILENIDHIWELLNTLWDKASEMENYVRGPGGVADRLAALDDGPGGDLPQ